MNHDYLNHIKTLLTFWCDCFIFIFYTNLLVLKLIPQWQKKKKNFYFLKNTITRIFFFEFVINVYSIVNYNDIF